MARTPLLSTASVWRAWSLDRVLLIAIFIPVGAINLEGKLLFLTNTPKFGGEGRVLAQFVGRLGRHDMNWIEYFSFYLLQDFLIMFCLVPLAIFFLSLFIGKRLLAVTLLAISIILQIFLFFNARTYFQFGRFLDLGMVIDGLQWAWNHPSVTTEYIPLKSIIAWMICMMLSTCFCALIWRGRDDRAASGPYWSWLRAGFALALVGTTGLTTAAAATPFASASRFRPPAFAVLAAKGIFWDADELSAMRRLAPTEAIQRFHDMTRTPTLQSDDRYFGKAANANLLMYILETAPTRCLDLDAELEHLPNLRALRATALRARNHYTSYPYTTVAHFSMFSGLYPWESYRQTLRDRPRSMQVGLMRQLADRGYAVEIYAPAPSFDRDETMYAMLGFQRQFNASQEPQSPAVAERLRRVLVSQAQLAKGELPLPADSPLVLSRTGVVDRMALDLGAVEAAKQAISAHARTGRRFAIVLAPQIGHVPWPDIHGHGDRQIDRCRAVAAYQDRWIGELLEVLEREDVRRDTIVLVTADHGFRSRGEDPAFNPAFVNEDSFRVPMLIDVPGLSVPERDIAAVTSHVDLAPSLSELLGISSELTPRHGMPMWDSRIGQRITFFLGRGLIGNDGFHSQGRFYMYNHVSDEVLAGSRMRFTATDRLDEKGEDAVMARRTVREFTALMERWVGLPQELAANR